MSDDIYTCKTCCKQFKSISALHGHSRMHGPSNGSTTHAKCCCIITKRVISIRDLKKYQSSLLKCKNPKCNNMFRPDTGHKYYCNGHCSTAHTNILRVKPIEYMNEVKKYKQRCLFQFDLGLYPNEFNLDYLHLRGIYHPVTNKKGLSRDHIYSMHDGFINKIEPIIISHPANCRLMSQSKNSSKNRDSHITIKELHKRIDAWNEKYDLK